jgi:hypothetical protein
MSLIIGRYPMLVNKQGRILKLLKIYKNKIANCEIYISEVRPGIEKGWNFHKKYKCNFFLISGSVIIKICKNYKNSKIKVIHLSMNRNNKLVLPSKTWFSFKSSSKTQSAKILNFLSGIHSKKETLKKDIKNFKHPFNL